MSYIRWSTDVRRAKADKRFAKVSETYAWGDVDGYVHIANGRKRGKLVTGKESNPKVMLTHAEMRHMCRRYMRRHGLKLG